jgi:hypothetical protein
MEDEEVDVAKDGELDASKMFEAFFESVTQVAESESSELLETVTIERIERVVAQKANSLLKYIRSYKAGNAPWVTPDTELILLEDGFDVINAAFKRTGDVSFLRACPEFARHGVLESLKVEQSDLRAQWKYLVDVMKREDPNGCLILQPFIPATTSCVLAPQQYASVGVGHDGITAGHGYDAYFLMSPSESTLTEHMETIGHKHGEYELEFVYDGTPNFNVSRAAVGTPYLTQIRGAPPHPIMGAPFNYKDEDGIIRTADTHVAIPDGRIECKEVWVASGLESVAYLEEFITKDKCPEGYVISEPNGSLLSHICAHARQHSIPYVVGEVNVGDKWTEGSPCWGALDPTWSIKPQPYDPCSPDYLAQFSAGLLHSKTTWQRQQGWLAHFFHQWVGTGTNGKHTAYLAGGFCGWMAKAILALGLGELRHANTLKKNITVDTWPVLTAMMGQNNWRDVSGHYYATPNGVTGGRLHYYAMMEHLDLNYDEIKLALEWTSKQFTSGWSGAYGGKAWADCCNRGISLCEAIIKFEEDGNAETLKVLLGAVNSAKNAEHNNGFLYGKFLSKKAFDYSSMHTEEMADGTHRQTGLFSHDPSAIQDMFRAFEITRSFVESKGNHMVARPVNDWTQLFKFVKGKTPTYWRNNFIAESQNIPVYLREAAERCGEEYLHFNNKFSHEEHFVPCGIEHCVKCKEHDVVVMKLQYGKDIAGLLLTPEYPEVFFAQGEEKSSVMSYGTVQMLRDREYDKITPRMWLEAWKGLNNQDPVFPELSSLLTKFVKNQMADSQEWTEKVLHIFNEMKEEVE